MLINEIMKTNLITITPETKLSDAYKLMQEKKVRHLPVVENNNLVGIVTDRDLRLSTSKLTPHPFTPDSIIKNIMKHPVQTIHPNDPVELSAQIMRDLRIGCLPVISENKMIGIVTNTDLLDALIMLTGVRQPSSRLDVSLSNRSTDFAKLLAILAERKINIHSILSYTDNNNQIRVALRIATIDVKSLAKELCSKGIKVIWPADLKCVM